MRFAKGEEVGGISGQKFKTGFVQTVWTKGRLRKRVIKGANKVLITLNPLAAILAKVFSMSSSQR